MNAFEITPGTAYMASTIVGLSEESTDDDLIEGLLGRDSLLLLAGDAKTGKSVLCTNLAMSVALGKPWLGLKVKQGNVLWFCYEESARERAHALRPYGELEGVPFQIVWPMEDWLIDHYDGLGFLESSIAHLKPALIVIDPLVAATGNTDYETPGMGRNKLTKLKDLCNDHGVCVIVIHHLNKDFRSGSGYSRHAGSHQLVATASADWTLTSSISSESREIRIATRSRIYGHRNLVVQSSGMTDFRMVEKSNSEVVQREVILDALKKGSDQGLKVPELSAETSYSEYQVRKILKALVDEAIVIQKGEAKARRYFASGGPKRAED